MIESEKTLERKLTKRVKDLGGMSVKLAASHFIGLPDRVCLLPGGFIFFAEIKTTGKKPTKIQNLTHSRIRNIGFEVYIVDKTEVIENILKRYEDEKNRLYSKR